LVQQNTRRLITQVRYRHGHHLFALTLACALTRYLEDGSIEIDNSAAERALRAVALGRKDHLFAGSDAGGENKAAAIYTLLGTARLNGIDPERWLCEVLSRIPDHPLSRIDELLPWNMTLNSQTHSPQAKRSTRQHGHPVLEHGRPLTSSGRFSVAGVHVVGHVSLHKSVGDLPEIRRETCDGLRANLRR
jgi:hypothetical protein